MSMNWSNARKSQLYQIAIDDDVPLEIRYEAVKEMVRRGKRNCPDNVYSYDPREEQKIAQLYFDGYFLSTIAARFGRSKASIMTKLRDMHKAGLPYRTYMRWTRNGKVPEYMKRQMSVFSAICTVPSVEGRVSEFMTNHSGKELWS